MTTTPGKLDRLIADAAAEANVAPVPVDMTHLTQERLDDRTYGAYIFNGNLLWWDLEPNEVTGPVPPGSRALYVRADDRG